MEKEGEEVYDYAARFDDIPVKGINFTGNRSINACFMAPFILSLPTWSQRERNREAFYWRPVCCLIVPVLPAQILRLV